MINKTSFSLRLFATAIAAMAIISTQALAYGPFGKPGSSSFSAGDSVVLNDTISIGAGSRIYIQGGVAKARRDIYEADPYCYFSLYRNSAVIKSPVSLEPEAFNVSKTSNYYELVQLNVEPYQIASRGAFSQDNSEKTLITRIRLSSATQPQVVGLHCGVWAVPNERNHVSLKEIKNALGDLVTLKLASE